MINIIVPLDFSETSLNAAHYAAGLYQGHPEANIILYHYLDTQEDISMANNYLSSLKNELSAGLRNIEIAVESGNNFIDSLTAYAHVNRAFMIIMGLTGKTPMAQRFSGSNTLKMAEKNICPVLIVPNDAK